MEKIKVTGTDFEIALDKVKKKIEVVSPISWDTSVEFVKQEQQLSLDESGDLFEPAYELHLEAKPKSAISLSLSYQAKELGKKVSEIQKFFAFIEDNKQNLFESLGLRGVLE